MMQSQPTGDDIAAAGILFAGAILVAGLLYGLLGNLFAERPPGQKGRKR